MYRPLVIASICTKYHCPNLNRYVFIMFTTLDNTIKYLTLTFEQNLENKKKPHHRSKAPLRDHFVRRPSVCHTWFADNFCTLRIGL